MELFLERLMSMEDKDSVLYGESFITRENDVYISTYPVNSLSFSFFLELLSF